ncbi:hypothetical protein M758_1G088800 [Ceratodon purpureus]|uniref:Uncharacterized protein n=1 Tax=Ceratodon purpureus TaxID=3225 RepID=A0A8T0J626_CERPU|nr:hypothetical protein KC19_1G093800 [Ceratodon purpureus]KAG0629256.1 hypothetical protein M758_1G088800 [Ceratodon purpureus]
MVASASCIIPFQTQIMVKNNGPVVIQTGRTMVMPKRGMMVKSNRMGAKRRHERRISKHEIQKIQELIPVPYILSCLGRRRTARCISSQNHIHKIKTRPGYEIYHHHVHGRIMLNSEPPLQKLLFHPSKAYGMVIVTKLGRRRSPTKDEAQEKQGTQCGVALQ